MFDFAADETTSTAAPPPPVYEELNQPVAAPAAVAAASTSPMEVRSGVFAACAACFARAAPLIGNPATVAEINRAARPLPLQSARMTTLNRRLSSATILWLWCGSSCAVRSWTALHRCWGDQVQEKEQLQKIRSLTLHSYVQQVGVAIAELDEVCVMDLS